MSQHKIHDFYSFLKKKRFERVDWNKFINEHNNYFWFSKRDKLYNNKPKDNRSLYFKNDIAYNLCFNNNILSESKQFCKKFSFKITLTSSLYTAAENEFYSIHNPIAKEKPTGIPILKGSSLKGALRQAGVECVEDELLKKNYFDNYYDKNADEILNEEKQNGNDRFFFKNRAHLVRLFGNEKEAIWFTFRSLLATGGIRDALKIKEVLNKISKAFENYLKYHKIIKDENSCRGRLIFSDFYFDKVSLDVITPLDRKKRTPVHGPIYYEVIPGGTNTIGTIIWFPFDLIAMGESEEEIKEEWKKDKEIIKRAFNKLKEKGIGAKTKDGWGRFDWKEI